MVISGDATKPIKAPNILCHRLIATHLRMILKQIPSPGRVDIGIRPNMPYHSLNPIGWQFDVIIQKRNIVAARFA